MLFGVIGLVKGVRDLFAACMKTVVMLDNLLAPAQEVIEYAVQVLCIPRQPRSTNPGGRSRPKARRASTVC